MHRPLNSISRLVGSGGQSVAEPDCDRQRYRASERDIVSIYDWSKAVSASPQRYIAQLLEVMVEPTDDPNVVRAVVLGEQRGARRTTVRNHYPVEFDCTVMSVSIESFGYCYLL